MKEEGLASDFVDFHDTVLSGMDQMSATVTLHIELCFDGRAFGHFADPP